MINNKEIWSWKRPILYITIAKIETFIAYFVKMCWCLSHYADTEAINLCFWQTVFGRGANVAVLKRCTSKGKLIEWQFELMMRAIQRQQVYSVEHIFRSNTIYNGLNPPGNHNLSPNCNYPVLPEWIKWLNNNSDDSWSKRWKVSISYFPLNIQQKVLSFSCKFVWLP